MSSASTPRPSTTPTAPSEREIIRVHFDATRGGVPVRFAPKFVLNAKEDNCSFRLEPFGVYCEGPGWAITVPYAAVRAIDYWHG